MSELETLYRTQMKVVLWHHIRTSLDALQLNADITSLKSKPNKNKFTIISIQECERKIREFIS